MSNKEFTHKGFVHVSLGRNRTVSLRQTRLYWVTDTGIKYRKSDGFPAGVILPYTHLDLNSVVEQ